ncbi:MAG: class I SAM-dependent methyltransferase, partial [Cyanobacteria bacterium]|nr:class I SAM-dependent methyltransferase [Cyanobacteriota bacterium]
MFDSHPLTPELKNYLSAEAEFLGTVMQDGSYKTLIEVGCGYGRYLDWALSRGYHYVGMDIVQWLVDLGQVRTARAKKKFPHLSCGVIRHPAEEIDRAVRELSLDHPEQKALVFFPFNCMGNVAQFDTVVDSLGRSNLDLVVSTFKTDATSTKFRKEYYGKCGYEQLNSRILKQGLLIISEEGFHAMAYHQDVLVNSFKKRGFDLEKQDVSVSVGNILFLKHGKPANSGDSVEPERSSAARGSSIEIAMYAIVDDPILQLAPETPSSGELLTFNEIPVLCRPLSSDELQGRCQVAVEPGTPLRLVLPVMPQNTSSKDERLWYADLIGELVSCEPGDNNDFEVIIKLNKT